MLTLYPENNDIRRTARYEETWLHHDIVGAMNRGSVVGYVNSANIGMPWYPYTFREAPIREFCTAFTTSEANSIDNNTVPLYRIASDKVIAIKNYLNSAQFIDGTIKILFVYGTKPLYEALLNELAASNDAWFDGLTEIDTNLKGIYDKCVQQISERELTDPVTCKILVNKTKRLVVVGTDYVDPTQASLYYLTLGELPNLLPDIKPLFNNQELFYFAELVHRSQLKRITNSEASRLYTVLFGTQDYKDSIDRIKYESLVNNMLLRRTQSLEYSITELENKMSMALEDYRKFTKDYYLKQRLIESYKQDSKAFEDEIRVALKTEGVVDTKLQSALLYITIKTPVRFFETDEADIVIKGRLYNEFLKWLFNKLFIEQSYKLMCLYRFKFDLENDNTRHDQDVLVATSQDIAVDFNAMCNPHLKYYSCVGDYKPTLLKAASTQDLLLFINTAVASVGSINFRDGVVMNTWITKLKQVVEQDHMSELDNVYNLSKCIVDSEGNEHTIKEMRAIYDAEIAANAPTIEVHDTLATHEDDTDEDDTDEEGADENGTEWID